MKEWIVCRLNNLTNTEEYAFINWEDNTPTDVEWIHDIYYADKFQTEEKAIEVFSKVGPIDLTPVTEGNYTYYTASYEF